MAEGGARRGSACARWFSAAEETGEFLGIRFGRVPGGAGEVEWLYVSHSECDGIGGFARLLRERGLDVGALPQTNHPHRRWVRPLWNFFCRKRQKEKRAVRADWVTTEKPESEASKAVAWKLFSEEETAEILQGCRKEGVTLNSFLLKHLDLAVRPEVSKKDAVITWMIPVNLRGDVVHADDTENHVSSVEVDVSSDDAAAGIQRGIRERLEQGEHRAKHLLLCMGKHLGRRTKKWLLCKSWDEPMGSIGAFSNLGVWDAGKVLATDDAWLFCPPLSKVQMLGAGCVTFQNRLSLMVQGNPELTEEDGVAEAWMDRWVASLRTQGGAC